MTKFKLSLVLVGIAIGLGLIFDYLFFDKLSGVSVLIYTLLALGTAVGVARYTTTPIPRAASYFAAPAVFFAAMTAVLAAEWLTFFNLLATAYLLAMTVCSIFQPQVLQYTLRNYAAPLMELPRRLVYAAVGTLAQAASVRSVVAKHQSLPQVLRGVAIAIPVLALFTILFASADLVFRQYVSDIFGFSVNVELVWRLVMVAVIAGLFTGALSMAAGQAADSAKPAKVPGRRFALGHIEMLVIFGSVNALFLTFIAIQLKYFFGGEHAIAQGLTYAQYARKGFFELIAVATIAFVLIYAIEKLLARQAEVHSRQFKILSAALVAQVLIIMLSAFQRLSLYEQAYGFTTLRLLSHIFVVWLAVVFGVLLYKIFSRMTQGVFLAFLVAAVVGLLGFVNVLNVDAFVARKNIGRYYATGKLDKGYLSGSSDDALPAVAHFARTVPDRKVARDMRILLEYRQYQRNSVRDHNWQSANISRSAADKALQGFTPHRGPYQADEQAYLLD